MNLASSVVIKQYYKYERMLLKNLSGLYPVNPLLILKIHQLSARVNVISVHFPPTSQFPSADHVILSQSWLLLLPLIETLPSPR